MIKYRELRLDVNACELSPLSPRLELSESQEMLLEDDIKRQRTPISPCYGIVTSKESIQLFLGGYQLEAYKKALPGKAIPVRLGITQSFTSSQITEIVLDKKLSDTLEGAYIHKAKYIENLRRWNDFTDADIAKHSGMTRGSITQFRKLLTLRKGVQDLLTAGSISFSVARELSFIPPSEQTALCKKIIQNKLDVTQVRRAVAKFKNKRPESESANASSNVRSNNTAAVHEPVAKSADILRLEEQISEKGHAATLTPSSDGSGEISLQAYSELELSGLAELLTNHSYRQGKVRVVVSYDNYEDLDLALSNIFPKEEDW